MKDLKIIGLIAVLFILFDFLTGFWDGSKEDYSVFAVEKTSDLVGKLFPVEVTVLPDSTIQVYNSIVGKEVPAGFTQCMTYIAQGSEHILSLILLAVVGLAGIYGMYSLIRLIISVFRKDVFTDANICRIRWFTYSTLLLAVATHFLDWLYSVEAVSQLHIPGYAIQTSSFFDGSWADWGVMILLTEIFVAAVRIKQENDLTI